MLSNIKYYYTHYLSKLHTDLSISDSCYINQIIVFTIFQLIWQQTEITIVPYQLENTILFLLI